MQDVRRSITLYASDFEYGRWLEVCEKAGAPSTATTITIDFNSSDVEYKEEEDE